MSTVDRGLHLTLQESLARDLIVERVARRHRASRRRPSRAALLLRSIADRLDHSDGGADREQTPRAGLTVGAPRVAAARPHAGQPRPWSAQPRRAPHRHS
jgi:hypothetical protein